MRRVSTSVIFGTRTPLNARIIRAPWMQRLQGSSASWCVVEQGPLCNRPAVAPCCVAGARDRGPAASPHGAIRHLAAASRVALLAASSPREVSDMGGRRRQRTMRLMIDGSIYGPAWRQAI
jgi:hypothetical protein